MATLANVIIEETDQEIGQMYFEQLPIVGDLFQFGGEVREVQARVFHQQDNDKEVVEALWTLLV